MIHHFAVAGWTATVCLLAAAIARADEPPVFERDVLPIFTKYCFNCHGKSSPQLGLDLRTARLALRGSQNGPVIVKGEPEKSLLWKKIAAREMPLKQFKLKLTNQELETVRRWIAAGALSSAPRRLPDDVQRQLEYFETAVKPILEQRCVGCHSDSDAEGELDLSSLVGLLRGSASGPVIVEGFSEKSVLVRKVAAGAMPPPDSDERLTSGELDVLKRWIDKGRFADFVDVSPRRNSPVKTPVIADSDRQFWAFRPPVQPELPVVRAAERVRTPIDRFILARLEAAGLSFSADAAPETLLRRACFDLTGLPPTPDLRRQFLNDRRPDAYARLIDRLLASPQYGERWGRHWLDAVGYVDTTGKDFVVNKATLSDGYWRYRDYVINSTNRDVPWNRFLVEQFAGDELVDWRKAKKFTPEIRRLLAATGYLRNILDATNEDISNLPFDRYEAMFMLMDRVSTSTLGLTMACARCHDHKFDPIPQTDYYRFLAIFGAAYNPQAWLQPKTRFLPNVSKAEQAVIDQRKQSITAERDQLRQNLKRLEATYRAQLQQQKVAALPESARESVATALSTAAQKRTPAQKNLLKEYDKQLVVGDSELLAALSPQDREQATSLRQALTRRDSLLASFTLEKLQALWDVGPAPTMRLLHRGDVDFAGPVVTPGYLTVLSPRGQANAAPSPAALGQTTGLRLGLAEWLTRPDHPLTARVIVNRIWQHHFGSGIVSTPGNFGETGARPSHPKLLDWLAVNFTQQGWSAKRLHKLMMLSTVYRQTSSKSSQPSAQRDVDPENQLLWRANLRRLEAEALRDAIISVSGHGNRAMGGPPIELQAAQSGLQTVKSQADGRHVRRSIYLVSRRSNPVNFLRVFDYPVIDVNCTRRAQSATPLQSLTMINSEFLVSSASRLTDRVISQLGFRAPSESRVTLAYQIILGRDPTAREMQTTRDHLDHLQRLYADDGDVESAARRAFRDFAHMLLCSNEFLYVD